MGFVKIAKRCLSTRKLYLPRVCIVGAGPAGFYAAMHLHKKMNGVHIDIIEQLPVPFGLVRYGVAPDHPEVKNVINQFTKFAQQENVNFYGNISLGRDIRLQQLREHYDAVLLSYGAEEDKTLGIENEDANNVLGARSFVGWYNGHPRFRDMKVDLSGSTAAILGQGNVALDVSRILLSPVDALRKTDITDYALQSISESKIRELYLVGRRGPLQVAFTIKELREQLKLDKCKTVWREKDFEGIAATVNDLPRPRKRLTELMLKSLSEMDSTATDSDHKLFKPIFFRSPQAFLIDDNKKVTGVELICNKLVGNSIEDQRCVPTRDTERLNCDLVFRSIGYKSVNVDNDLKFTSGVVKNDKGKVDISNDNLAPVFVAGWLGTGPVGVLLHTMGNAFQVAKLMCENLKEVDTFKGGMEEIKKMMTKPSNEIIEWSGWEKIDKYEIEQGNKVGKPREKVTSVPKMIEIANM
ncbi:NADPH:adrenodoxin oxidoreductase, mitochondrial [Aricia agestis]|uniref:NADPH:adrenodoxin oxidoreductase, mitochondrial n=1 Tax=Aricia agestis TaxID=91739 RepID=UPI001C201776|nr:NADPH:adrenodoxin oxidoreductase, mitochondrial [Aricia agestis]